MPRAPHSEITQSSRAARRGIPAASAVLRLAWRRSALRRTGGPPDVLGDEGPKVRPSVEDLTKNFNVWNPASGHPVFLQGAHTQPEKGCRLILIQEVKLGVVAYGPRRCVISHCDPLGATLMGSEELAPPWISNYPFRRLFADRVPGQLSRRATSATPFPIP